VEKREKKLELAKEKQRISQRNNSCQNITKIKIWYRIKDWSWPSFRSRMNGHKKQRWPEVAEVGQEGAVQGRSEPPARRKIRQAVRPSGRPRHDLISKFILQAGGRSASSRAWRGGVLKGVF